jgi:anti-sigma B factor antagonist
MHDDIEFNVTRRREGGMVVVVPEGEIDLVTAKDVRSQMRAAREEGQSLVLDLRSVTFMDSSGLRLVVEAQRDAEAHGSEWTLVRGPQHVDRLLTLVGLASRMTIVDDPAEAQER